MGKINSKDKGARWLPVVGYEGLYEVSDEGEIKSLPRNTTSGGILKQSVNKKNGYCYVGLHKENKSTTHRVHVLLMKAFCPNNDFDENGLPFEVDHIDGDKQNNSLSNLQWLSHKDNMRKRKNVRYQTKAVIDLDTLEIFNSEQEAGAKYGGRCTSIHRVCVGRRSHYKGKHFAFLSDYQNNTIPAFRGKWERKANG